MLLQWKIRLYITVSSYFICRRLWWCSDTHIVIEMTTIRVYILKKIIFLEILYIEVMQWNFTKLISRTCQAYLCLQNYLYKHQISLLNIFILCNVNSRKTWFDFVLVHIWCFAWFGIICAIWNSWKTPMEEWYFLQCCRLYSAVLLLHKSFSCLLNCKNGFKSSKAFHIFLVVNIFCMI